MSLSWLGRRGLGGEDFRQNVNRGNTNTTKSRKAERGRCESLGTATGGIRLRSGSSLEVRMEACVIRIGDGLEPTVASRHNSQGTKCTAPNNTHIHNVSINIARLEDSCCGHKHISNRIKGDPPKVRGRVMFRGQRSGGPEGRRGASEV